MRISKLLRNEGQESQTVIPAKAGIHTALNMPDWYLWTPAPAPDHDMEFAGVTQPFSVRP